MTFNILHESCPRNSKCSNILTWREFCDRVCYHYMGTVSIGETLNLRLSNNETKHNLYIVGKEL
jgi:hypothetical protein